MLIADMLRLQFDCMGTDWGGLEELFAAAALGGRKGDKIRRAFENSSVVCFGYHGTRLVAAARALTDHEYHATIYDVVVHPDLQRHGIGRRILREVLVRLPVWRILLMNFSGKPNPRSWMITGHSSCDIHSGSAACGVSCVTRKPSRISRTKRREQLNALAISRTLRPSASRRLISSCLCTVNSLRAIQIGHRVGSGLPPKMHRLLTSPFRSWSRGGVQKRAPSGSKSGSGRWSHSEEIGWVHSQEIGWSHS